MFESTVQILGTVVMCWIEWIKCLHSAEKRKNLYHGKVFRQLISLVTTLVKTLHSRNFRQKSVMVNLRNFHTVAYK